MYNLAAPLARTSPYQLHAFESRRAHRHDLRLAAERLVSEHRSVFAVALAVPVHVLQLGGLAEYGLEGEADAAFGARDGRVRGRAGARG